MSKQEQTTSDEVKEHIKEKIRAFQNWLKPNRDENIFVQVLKLILKIPIAIFVIAASPILLIILVVVFVATF